MTIAELRKLFAVVVTASTLACVSVAQAQQDADVSALKGICLDISTQLPYIKQPELISYMYEKKIYDAARVNFRQNTPAQAREKIRKLWINHQPYFRCQANNFNVRDGNVLKYAIATRSFNLIDDAAKIWGIDLNLVDPSDNRTVLDYAEDQRSLYKGTAMEDELTSYIGILVRHGAKHRRDL